MPLDRRDQCASSEPQVEYFGKLPFPASQPGLSVLVVGGLKIYNTMVENNTRKNTCQDPARKMIGNYASNL